MQNNDPTGWFPLELDELATPGETLRETLEHLEMSQSKLAARTGLTLKHVNQIVQGNASITPATALTLERVTGVPASLWNNLEAEYQDRKVRATEISSLAEDSAWLDKMPLNHLRKKGYLTATRSNPGKLLQEVLAFFGVGTIAAWESTCARPAAAFLQSSAYQVDPGAVSVWLRLGEMEADAVGQRQDFLPFDRARLKAVLPKLRAMTTLTPDVFYPELESICASVGVCLVVVPDVAGTRASGATRFLSPNRAIVQLSNRGKRNDKFWFAFFHELGHLLLHSKKDTFLQFENQSPSGSSAGVEQEANDFAGQLLIPIEAEAELLAIRTPTDARVLADRLGIAPAIVAGRYQRETKNWTFGKSLFQTYEIRE